MVLVGHSAGWAAVTQYQADRQDRRVVGVVVASGSVHPGTGPTDPDQIAQATRMMAEGRPDDLVRDPKRSFPSFISAATMLDIVNSPPELKDFFGTRTETRNPGVTRIRCPLLAFYGTKGDVGDAAELELLKSSIQRQSSGPSRVNTVMIKNADHMYAGEEGQVAETIAEWAATLGPTGKRRSPRQTVGVERIRGASDAPFKSDSGRGSLARPAVGPACCSASSRSRASRCRSECGKLFGSRREADSATWDWHPPHEQK